MELKNTPSVNFTDYEAYHFLREIKSGQQRNTPTPLATITYEALRYLDDRPGAKMTAEQIQKAQASYKTLPFALKPNCIAQLMNDPPQGMVDVQVLLGDDIHDRTDEDIEAILAVSKEAFGDLSKVETDNNS